MSFLAKTNSRAEYGLNAPLVEIEAHLMNGLPSFSIVGLPETTVKESRERVSSAIINSQFDIHKKRTTINLSPANLPKSGGRFDLPIAMALLLSSKQVKPQLEVNNIEFYGELALDGSLRFTSGLFPAVLKASQHNKQIIVPDSNMAELSLIKQANLIPCANLLEVCAIITGSQVTIPLTAKKLESSPQTHLDFCQIRGQQQAKRALEIAASGGHNVLLIGTPGAGKTMLAERLPSILPNLSAEEILEKLSILSVAGEAISPDDASVPQFRTPHHGASAVALIGGGSHPKPGEISLAHKGVLFLDELPEFPRHSIESLRQPLENKVVHLSRALGKVSYPADFQLIAAMNPCPCGFLGDNRKACHCTADQINKYRHKISGPLLDRIDMILEVPALKTNELLDMDNSNEEKSVSIKIRINNAYQKQIRRQHKQNARLNNQDISQHITLCPDNKALLEQAINQLGLSARSYYRILKVARTIADLADNTDITNEHLSEAISYRRYEL